MLCRANMLLTTRAFPLIVTVELFSSSEFFECRRQATDVLLTNFECKIEKRIISVGFVPTFVAFELTPKITSKYAVDKRCLVQSRYGQFITPPTRIRIDTSCKQLPFVHGIQQVNYLLYIQTRKVRNENLPCKIKCHASVVLT